MNYQRELEEMRANYARKPLQLKKLPYPLWMTKMDPLHKIYDEKDLLFEKGQVYYAQIVQANAIAFKRFPGRDCAACLVYSTTQTGDCNPEMLGGIARELYSYKYDTRRPVPEHMKEIVRLIRDEYERTVVPFQLMTTEGNNMDMRFQPFVLFRKHMPCKILKNGFIPILAAPEYCESVMLLPKQYWTKDFADAWTNGTY